MFFLGDVHNQFADLADLISGSDLHDDTIFQVGDFGLGILEPMKENDQLRKLNEVCSRKSLRLIAIRGNHDDPARFDGRSSPHSNIFFASDYSMFKVDGMTILLAGGGISIDRSRRADLPYWSDEKFKFDRSMLNGFPNQFKKIDIVVTHSCPGEFQPFQYGSLAHKYAERDDTLIQDLNTDRQEHSRLLKFLIESSSTPRLWYYGHWHSPYLGSYMGVQYQALDIFEMVELK